MSHSERLLPIGVAAVEVCARLCSWLFQQPRLEHGFFLRTADPHDELWPGAAQAAAGAEEGGQAQGRQSAWADATARRHRTYHALSRRLRCSAWERGGSVHTLDAVALGADHAWIDDCSGRVRRVLAKELLPAFLLTGNAA